MDKKIYCFDLDGVICSQEKDYHNAKPFKKRIEIINELYDAGHKILIDSARGTITRINHQQYTEFQLKRWGVKYHLLRTGIKFFADKYIDDHGVSDIDFFKR